MKKSNLYAVLIAGGSGTRFWPLSRELYPKQLLRLVGAETLLQRTLLVAQRVTAPDQILVVTNRQQFDAVRSQAAAVLPLPDGRILAEPRSRNTAAAIGLAALKLARRDPGAVMLVMPSDHIILKPARFVGAVRAAEALARKGWLVTLGIRPDYPETGYGYIRRGPAIPGRWKAYRVSRFAEKPSLSAARRYLSSGGYFWNSGIFVWTAGALLKAIGEFQPRLAMGLEAVAETPEGAQEEKVIEKVYEGLESVSIDYGVLEKMRDHLAVVPVEMGWSDVGSWSALKRISRSDARGNVTSGNVIDLGSRNSILYADKRLVATIGLEGLVVVDTEDATLVCHLDRVQDVRKMVDILRQRNAEEHLIHRTVWRPWGSFTVLENGDRYKIKRIVVNPTSRLSLQLHHRRSEHWVVVAGTARVTRGEEVFDLGVNESTYIPIETKHRLENPGAVPLQIIEVQNGEYLGEDDIVRFQDDYGRRR